uniref:Uncharacterized protein n=1 Tax=Streptomyces sp. NBC_00003 TaxID=2903608 RepID=A0AAU2VH41_9ACTN
MPVTYEARSLRSHAAAWAISSGAAARRSAPGRPGDLKTIAAPLDWLGLPHLADRDPAGAQGTFTLEGFNGGAPAQFRATGGDMVNVQFPVLANRTRCDFSAGHRLDFLKIKMPIVSDGFEQQANSE